MKSYLEDTAAYLSIDKKQRVLEELYYNSFRTIKSVYIFKNFEEYTIQLKADKNEDKKDVYWNASYYEKLIDYVKISIAFENYNKAVLIENGYLVHKIKKKWKPTAHSGTFVFARRKSQRFAKPKEPNFCQHTD